MKNDEVIYLLLGGLILYILTQQNTGASAAQNQINATNLNATNTVANTNALANAATNVASDIANIGNAWS